MTREQKLESMLMQLFTLAPNVKQKHWDEIYEQYKNISTIVQQPLSGLQGSPKSCPNCDCKELEDTFKLAPHKKCLHCGHDFR
jgi:predicted Zn-ribbon and HTH transcriptional regulator